MTNLLAGDESDHRFVGSARTRLRPVGARIANRRARVFRLVPGPPKIDTVEIRFINDPNAVLAHLLSGEIDLAWTPLVRFDIPTAQQLWGDRGQGYLTSWATRVRYLEFRVPGGARLAARGHRPQGPSGADSGYRPTGDRGRDDRRTEPGI